MKSKYYFERIHVFCETPNRYEMMHEEVFYPILNPVTFKLDEEIGAGMINEVLYLVLLEKRF